MESYTREQIKDALAQKYRVAYNVYEQLALTGKELIREGDMEANAIISQRALLRSQYLYGIKTAAEVLGIGDAEFMEAVNQNQPAQAVESGKEEEKCKEPC